MADVDSINQVTADPEFAKLPPESQKEILLHLSGSGIQSTPQSKSQGKTYADRAIDFLRPWIAGSLADVAAGASAPSAPVTFGIGPLAAYGGTYAATDAALQYLKSSGQRPTSIGSALAEGGVNAGIQKVLGFGTNKFLGAVKAFTNADQPEILKFLPTVSQALTAEDHPLAAGISKYFEDLAVGSKNAALDRTAGAGFGRALEFLKSPFSDLGIMGSDWRSALNMQRVIKKLGPTIPGTESGIGELATSLGNVDKVIADSKTLGKVLTESQITGAGDNVRKILGNYQFAKIFNNAASYDLSINPIQGNIKRLSAKYIDDALADKSMQDSYELLYGKQGFSRVKQFFQNITDTQDIISPAAYRKMWLMSGGVGLATSLFSDTPIATGLKGITAIYLGAKGLGALLNNPKTAQLALALSKGAPLSVAEKRATSSLIKTLQGTTLGLIHSDGSITPAQTTQDGIIPMNSNTPITIK